MACTFYFVVGCLLSFVAIIWSVLNLLIRLSFHHFAMCSRVCCLFWITLLQHKTYIRCAASAMRMRNSWDHPFSLFVFLLSGPAALGGGLVVSILYPRMVPSFIWGQFLAG